MTPARARARGITRWPPATSVSLFAVATTLPARRAARTGRRLTIPPGPTITLSTSARGEAGRAAPAPAGPHDHHVDVVAGRELDEGLLTAEPLGSRRQVDSGLVVV